MAIAFVRQASTSGTAQPLAVTISTAAGNFLIACISASGDDITGVTDSAGNTWTQAVTKVITNETRSAQIWYTANAAAVTSVSVAHSNSAATVYVNVSEWSGLAASTPGDGTSSDTGTSTDILVGSVATANASDLLIATNIHVNWATNTAARDSFTDLTTASTSWHNSAYRIVGVTGTYTTSWGMSTSQKWAGVIAAFKEASATQYQQPVNAVVTPAPALTTKSSFKRALTIAATTAASLVSGFKNYVTLTANAYAVLVGGYGQEVRSHRPTAYWRLGEASGTTADDEVGSNDGTYNGPTLGQPGLLASDPDTCPLFDGVNDHITTLLAANPSLTDFSVEAWAIGNVNGRTVVQQNDGGGTGRAWIYTDGSGVISSFAGGAQLSSGVFMGPNVARHIVTTYEKATTTLRIYVDGVLGNSAVRSVESCAGTWQIGAGKSVTQPWDGRIDEVAIYERLLTAAEITAHYDKGTVAPSSMFTKKVKKTISAVGGFVASLARVITRDATGWVRLSDAAVNDVTLTDAGVASAALSDSAVATVTLSDETP